MKSFYDWQSNLQAKIYQINERLVQSIYTSQSDLYDMARYTIDSGGKRFRPLLTILVYSMISDKPYEDILDLAAGYELIHTASLIHDDIIDRSDMRRGRPTLNKRFGVENAIVVGDYLFAKAYELGSRYGPVVSKIMADGSSRLAEGQTLEFLNRGNLYLSENTYLEIIAGKTAHFFEACARGSSVAAGGSAEITDYVSLFAFNLGMAFQITDDILDFISTEDREGKPTFQDIRENVMTLPLIRSISKDGNSGKILDLLKNGGSVSDLKEVLLKDGSIEYSFDTASRYIKNAISYLRKTEKSPNIDTLMDLAMIVIDRISSLK
ncbi:MAG: polyprenyl synthetase family protein [Candidatus Thermoplasmatota archaeon]|nr:polyprenyl synthetase family protein [Candidatus Thermoplasmatota archaeon]MCL5666134.1 polyprenyl synthetase family protein [Candidatus Thermoplasmatota archaeon]